MRAEPPADDAVPLDDGVVWTASGSDLPRTRATPRPIHPSGLPRGPHSASVTRGVLRMRLAFHDSSSVMTSSRRRRARAQIAVGLGLPSLVNVVSRM